MGVCLRIARYWFRNALQYDSGNRRLLNLTRDRCRYSSHRNMHQILTTILLAFAVSLSGCAETPTRSSQGDYEVPGTGSTGAHSELGVDAPDPEDEQDPFGDKFPEVLAVEATPTGEKKLRFSVSLSSTCDTAQRYADAWRVLDESYHGVTGFMIDEHDIEGMAEHMTQLANDFELAKQQGLAGRRKIEGIGDFKKLGEKIAAFFEQKS